MFREFFFFFRFRFRGHRSLVNVVGVVDSEKRKRRGREFAPPRNRIRFCRPRPRPGTTTGKKKRREKKTPSLPFLLTEQNLAFPSRSIARDSLAVARSTSLSRVAIEGLSIERDVREPGGFPARSDELSDVDCCRAGVAAVVVVGSSAAARTASSSPSAKLTFCFDFGRGCDRLFGFEEKRASC